MAKQRHYTNGLIRNQEQELKELGLENAKMKAKIDTISNEKKELEKAFETLNKLKNDADKKIETLENANQKLRIKAEEDRIKIEALQSENDKYVEELILAEESKCEQPEKQPEKKPVEIPMTNGVALELLSSLQEKVLDMRESIAKAQEAIINKKRRRFS